MNTEEIFRTALEFIASKSICDCFDQPGMGSNLPYVWKGCETYHSNDPDEWCLCCIAHASLTKVKQK